MNMLAAVAGVLTLLAFTVHAVVGTMEFSRYVPRPKVDKPLTVWFQMLCGWHWVSTDLLLAAVLLLTIALTNRLSSESFILRILSAYFGLCGMVWLLTVMLAGKASLRMLIVLGQWLLCMLIASLCFFAA